MPKTSSNHVIWQHRIVEGACTLAGMTGYSDDWKLLYGESVVGAFPKQARFSMDPAYPKDVALTDSLYNTDMLIVASEALRAVIASESPAQVEYLPVPIDDHQKRAIPQPYVIVHPIDPVDCLVREACKPTDNKILQTEIDRVKKLVIDETRIRADRLLFRCKGFAREILVHRRLADKIDAAGLTGMRWVELADYPEI